MRYDAMADMDGDPEGAGRTGCKGLRPNFRAAQAPVV